MGEQREGIERVDDDRPSLVDGSSAPTDGQGERPPLVERVEVLLERADKALCTAEAWGDVKAMSAAVREVRATLELLGKVTGELRDGPVIEVNLSTSPEWHEVRARLIAALAPFPEARAAVAAALTGGEGHQVIKAGG